MVHKSHLTQADIVLIKESYVRRIFLAISNATKSTSFRVIIIKKLSPKDQYLAQKARDSYITSVCQLEPFFFIFFKLLK